MKKSISAAVITAAVLLSCTHAFALEQLDGWPQTVAGSNYYCNMGGLVMSDIDGDGLLEIIVATTGEELHVFKPDGTLVFTAALSGLAQNPPAVGDVVGGGGPEIVVATRDEMSGSPTPKMHVFSASGTLLSSAELTDGGALDSAPTLADLNGDGKLEIIEGERGSSAGRLHALDGSLNEIGSSWPATLDHVPATSAAAGDLDGDGETEVAVCSFLSLYAFEKDGAVMDGFPVTFENESYSYGSPALADLDGDGKPEIITTTHGDESFVHATRYDGTEIAGWPYSLGDTWSYSAPSAGDIDGDGSLEVVAGRAGGTVEDDGLFVIGADGSDWGTFPYSMAGGPEGNTVLADFAGDERLEIVFTNNLADGDMGYVFAVDADKNLLDGWPLRPEGFTYMNGATIGDANADGSPEFGILGCKGDGTISVNLYGNAEYAIGSGGAPWPTYQHDNRHSGLYGSAGNDFDDDADDDDADDSSDDSADDASDDESDDASDDEAEDDNSGCCG